MANDNKSYDELLSAFESSSAKPVNNTSKQSSNEPNRRQASSAGQSQQPVSRPYRQVNYGGTKPQRSAAPNGVNSVRPVPPPQQNTIPTSQEKKAYKNGVYFSNPPQKLNKNAQKQKATGRRRTPRVPQNATEPAGGNKFTNFFRKHGKSMLIKLAVIIGVSTILCVYGIGCINDVLALNVDETTKEIRIEEGMTDSQVINLLDDEGLINNKLFCKLFVKFMKLTSESSRDKVYISGVYTLSADLGVEKMLNTMQTDYHNSETVKLTFPEGWTIQEIAEKLETNGVCTASSFISTLDSVDFSDEYDFVKNIPNKEKRFRVLEGYIYPDTYDFYKGENASSVVRRFLDNFQNRWTEEYQEKAKKLGLTVDEVVIMASVLQAEAANGEQMPKIASVLYNRLDKSGTFPLLQCDSTEDYLREFVKPNLTSSIEDTQKYIEYRNNYDTYNDECKGLPVGAIGNPGDAAIKAALNPADTGYYYFRHDANGGIYYANTMKEHEENGRIAAKVKKDD